MAKRPTTSESHDTNSSEDEFQIDLYTDMLERLTVEQNDSSDSDIVPRRRRRSNVVTVNKPEMVLEYTANMGGVDRADQYASTYCFLRKSLKWWRKLFFWGFEMCVINHTSYIAPQNKQLMKRQ